jgi:3-isopropylmalate dehydratase small subunit
MIEKITGRVWKLGDNIDADVKLFPLPWGERVRVRGKR